jgi:hypothetical protein
MDDVITALVAALDTNISGWEVFYGNAPQEPDTVMPLISVSPINTSFSVRGTGGLRSEFFRIAITAYVDLKSYYEDAPDNTVDHAKDLIIVMEDRATNGLPVTASILGTVNDDLTISGTVQNVTEFDIAYDTIPTSRYATATLTILAERVLPLCTH